MIPWEKFATPLDAYEWAKRYAGKTLFCTGGWQPRRVFVVWTSRGGYIRPAFNNQVTR